MLINIALDRGTTNFNFLGLHLEEQKERRKNGV
jgi:hypothetical protein